MKKTYLVFLLVLICTSNIFSQINKKLDEFYITLANIEFGISTYTHDYTIMASAEVVRLHSVFYEKIDVSFSPFLAFAEFDSEIISFFNVEFRYNLFCFDGGRENEYFENFNVFISPYVSLNYLSYNLEKGFGVECLNIGSGIALSLSQRVKQSALRSFGELVIGYRYNNYEVHHHGLFIGIKGDFLGFLIRCSMLAKSLQ
jgi:hypothetical protein